MFLGKKLAERGQTRQRFHSKQGLSYPGFFLSIPVLNGVSDRWKPVKGFSHTVFHRFSPVFSLFGLSNPFKNHLKAKLHHFWRRFNSFLSKPIQRHSTPLVFSIKGYVFTCEISVKSVNRLWLKGFEQKKLAWVGLPRSLIIIIYM